MSADRGWDVLIGVLQGLTYAVCWLVAVIGWLLVIGISLGILGLLVYGVMRLAGLQVIAG